MCVCVCVCVYNCSNSSNITHVKVTFVFLGFDQVLNACCFCYHRYRFPKELEELFDQDQSVSLMVEQESFPVSLTRTTSKH